MNLSDTEMPGFCFDRDTFSFPNELVWEYRLDAATGKMQSFRNDPPPSYAHRCFVVARSARQFFYHARFDSGQARCSEQEYRALIRKVVSRSPRQACSCGEKISVPGYGCLREFSRGEEKLLKEECGGAWQSYVLRSHWRMVFPISRAHQEAMAFRLVESLKRNTIAVVHLVLFPQLTINHGVVVYGVEKVALGLRFLVYDPNVPDKPSELVFDRKERQFLFPANHYWAGGGLNVIEVYRGWFY